MLHTLRRGVTLIELLIFIVIFGFVAGLVVPFMVFTGENMVKQQGQFVVQRNGDYVLQVIGQQLKDGERVLDPPAGSTGSVVALQRSQDLLNPTLIGVRDGQVVIINHDSERIISTPDVVVSDMVVRNTSASADRQSASLSFKISQRVSLVQTESYVRTFETTFTLFPTDEPQGGLCGCTAPACSVDGVYTWHPCDGGSCGTNNTAMTCYR